MVAMVIKVWFCGQDEICLVKMCYVYYVSKMCVDNTILA